MMRTLVVVGLFLPHLVLAQGLNAGFVQGLWYSKTPFFAGDTVRIYTAIQNNSGFDIQGIVEFWVNSQVIRQSSFSAVNGRIVEAWADWNVSAGNHAVGAKVKEAFKLEVGKAPEPITLGSFELGTSQVFADQDADQDGIGNQEDEDDDNDLVLDTTEKTLRTDPLNADTDQDGLSDGKEIELGANPLSKDTKPAQEPLAEEPGDSFVESAAEKITREVLPAVEQTIDTLVENAVEQLKAKKAEIQQKKEAYAAGESPEPPTTGEQGLEFLLAAAIVALPQWQIGLFLSFAIAVALLFRRLTKEPPTER